MSTRTTAAALMLALLAGTASAQQMPPDTAAKRKAMAKLAFIVGDWSGEAYAFVGPGQRVNMLQTEWVRYKLKGLILAVEGVGRRLNPTTGPGDTLFNAWAVIDWTPDKGYVMRSNVLDGRTGEFPLEVSDSGFVWGMTFPAGRVRYIMRLLPSGEWHEKGEFTRDGTQWIPTVEMRLKKAQANTATP